MGYPTPTSRASSKGSAPFYVRHATFDKDVLVNRILAAAVRALTEYALAPPVLARLRACSLVFPEDLSGGARAEDCDRVVLSRNTAHYREALVLARLILERSAPELRSYAAARTRSSRCCLI